VPSVLRRAALGLLVLAVSGCTAAPQGDGRRPSARDREPERGPLTLLYLDGATLRALEVAGGRDRALTKLPGPDAHIAPRGGRIAVVGEAGRPREGAPDFLARPTLWLLDLRSGRRVELGPGVSPLWDADGTKLAWLRPVAPRECSAEGCTSDVEVVVLEIADMRARAWLPPGRWGLLSWAGERLLVAGADDLRVRLVSATQDPVIVDAAPSEVWGASPDGRFLLRVGRRGASVATLRGNGVTSVRPLPGGRRSFADGAWAPGSGPHELAVVELTEGGRLVPPSRVVVLSVEEPSVRSLRRTQGATGPVLWSPGGDAVAFARPSGPGGRRLEAVLCSVARSRPCRELLSWTRGVALLRLDRGLF